MKKDTVNKKELLKQLFFIIKLVHLNFNNNLFNV